MMMMLFGGGATEGSLWYKMFNTSNPTLKGDGIAKNTILHHKIALNLS